MCTLNMLVALTESLPGLRAWWKCSYWFHPPMTWLSGEERVAFSSSSACGSPCYNASVVEKATFSNSEKGPIYDSMGPDYMQGTIYLSWKFLGYTENPFAHARRALSNLIFSPPRAFLRPLTQERWSFLEGSAESLSWYNKASPALCPEWCSHLIFIPLLRTSLWAIF